MEAYAKAFKEKESVIGDPEQPGTEIGPVVDKAQFERIMKIITTAKDEQQGSLLSGGKAIGSKVGPEMKQLSRFKLTAMTGLLHRADNLYGYKRQCDNLQGRDIRARGGHQQI